MFDAVVMTCFAGRRPHAPRPARMLSASVPPLVKTTSSGWRGSTRKLPAGRFQPLFGRPAKKWLDASVT